MRSPDFHGFQKAGVCEYGNVKAIMIKDFYEWLIVEAGYAFYCMSACCATCAIARRNTVTLWMASGKVLNAEAGDPCELE